MTKYVYTFGDDRLPERFWSKCIPVTETGCWLWLKHKDNGYGQICIDSKMKYPHRVTYEAFVGEIPEGLQIDHLCRTRACCNPHHLEPVTRVENARRGIGSYDSRGGVCVRGHNVSEFGVKRDPNYPNAGQCRQCSREISKERREMVTVLRKHLGVTKVEFLSTYGNKVATHRKMVIDLGL